MNSVWNAWLTVAVVGLFGAAAAVWQWPQIYAFLREKYGLLLAGEALFAIAFVGFVLLRMGNPDLWQLWFGGEKFMEFAMLNGILRSPTFPPVDPHFAGGIINYYYFGLYLVAYLIKLTGIYAEVAFNLAIPGLFALTVVNAFAVAYSAVDLTRQGRIFQKAAARRATTPRPFIEEPAHDVAMNAMVTPTTIPTPAAVAAADEEVPAPPLATTERSEEGVVAVDTAEPQGTATHATAG
ncbi:MAG: DUF2298 domain-containing protein [Caldilineaceae bacterium]